MVPPAPPAPVSGRPAADAEWEELAKSQGAKPYDPKNAEEFLRRFGDVTEGMFDGFEDRLRAERAGRRDAECP
jgi:hypothetical protein